MTVAALAPSLDRTYWSSFDGAVDLAAPGLTSSRWIPRSPTSRRLLICSPAVPQWLRQSLLGSRRCCGPPTRHGPPNKLATSCETRHKISAYPVVTRTPGSAWSMPLLPWVLPLPLADPSDFFITWADSIYKGTAGATMVSWTTPQEHAVTGYTVTVHAADGTTTDYDVDGLTVRTEVVMLRGRGVDRNGAHNRW